MTFSNNIFNSKLSLHMCMCLIENISVLKFFVIIFITININIHSSDNNFVEAFNFNFNSFHIKSHGKKILREIGIGINAEQDQVYHAGHRPYFSDSETESSRDIDKVRFYLYTDPLRHNIEAGHELELRDLSTLKHSKLNRDREYKFLIHGFNHNYTCGFPQQTKDVYLERGYDINLIAVDWGLLATPKISHLTDYFHAVRSLPTVASQLSKLITILQEHHLLNLSSVHLIGFSLGAHIGGLTGKKIYNKFGDKISRITGLDPAGPLFNTGLLARRLRESDAKYVDVIHTDQGENGIFDSVGHADFYVNGGRPPQPGCKTNGACSHAAAVNYFLQSIGTSNSKYVGCKCLTYELYLSGLCNCDHASGAPFGENSKPGTAGSFYLKMKPVPFRRRYAC